MLMAHHFVENNLDAILHKNGTRNPYDRSVFMELCWISKVLAELIRPTGPVA